jgi:hypothetical protein
MYVESGASGIFFPDDEIKEIANHINALSDNIIAVLEKNAKQLLETKNTSILYED